MTGLAGPHEHPHGRYFAAILDDGVMLEATMRVSEPDVVKRWAAVIDEDRGAVAYVDPFVADALVDLLNVARQMFGQDGPTGLSTGEILARLSSSPLLRCASDDPGVGS